jgi:hypothetical protein
MCINSSIMCRLLLPKVRDCVFDSEAYISVVKCLDIDSGYSSSAVSITCHMFKLYVYMYIIYIYVYACSVAEI